MLSVLSWFARREGRNTTYASLNFGLCLSYRRKQCASLVVSCDVAEERPGTTDDPLGSTQSITHMTPEHIIDVLGLEPHPEGGWYAETWRGNESPRASGTAIYFLLQADESSHWHKVDAVELWHWYAGTTLSLHIHEAGSTRIETLGPNLLQNERPQVMVPKDAWQMAQPDGGWVLVGCTVSPGFEFSGFELADKQWSPE